MDKNYIKLTVSILLILLGTWLLFINEENPKISNRSMGDDSLVVIDLTKKRVYQGMCMLFLAAY